MSSPRELTERMLAVAAAWLGGAARLSLLDGARRAALLFGDRAVLHVRLTVAGQVLEVRRVPLRRLRRVSAGPRGLRLEASGAQDGFGFEPGGAWESGELGLLADVAQRLLTGAHKAPASRSIPWLLALCVALLFAACIDLPARGQIESPPSAASTTPSPSARPQRPGFDYVQGYWRKTRRGKYVYVKPHWRKKPARGILERITG